MALVCTLMPVKTNCAFFVEFVVRHISFLIAVVSFLWSASVFAQDCGNINEDETWLNGLDAMKWGLDNEDFDLTLDAGRSINSICPNSPIYLYYLAQAFKGKGDDANARKYIYKASDETFNFATAPQMSQNIWYLRYELDHPDRTEQAVHALEETVQNLKEENAGLKSNNAGEDLSREVQRENLYVGTWIGGGIGLAGVVMAVAGGVLVAIDDNNVDLKERNEFKDEDDALHKIDSYTVKSTYSAGLALLGTGIGFAVAGAIVSGYFGYQYRHLNEESAVSVSLSPNRISVGLTF